MSLIHAPTPVSIAIGAVMTLLDLWLRYHSNRAHRPPLALVPRSPGGSRRSRRLVPHGYDFFDPGPLAA